MVRNTFLTVFIILWLVVAAYMAVLAVISAFRRRRQAPAPSPTILPAGLHPGSPSGLGAPSGSIQPHAPGGKTGRTLTRSPITR